jgi:predicted DNA-binding WGR domain protein
MMANALKKAPDVKLTQDDFDDIKAIKELLKIPLIQKMIYRLECINKAKNERKFYELWVKPDEQGGFSMTAHWGRIGTSGQTKVLKSGSEKYCRSEAEEQASKKFAKGYRLVKHEVTTLVGKNHFV